MARGQGGQRGQPSGAVLTETGQQHQRCAAAGPGPRGGVGAVGRWNRRPATFSAWNGTGGAGAACSRRSLLICRRLAGPGLGCGVWDGSCRAGSAEHQQVGQVDQGADRRGLRVGGVSGPAGRSAADPHADHLPLYAQRVPAVHGLSRISSRAPGQQAPLLLRGTRRPTEGGVAPPHRSRRPDPLDSSMAGPHEQQRWRLPERAHGAASGSAGARRHCSS